MNTSYRTSGLGAVSQINHPSISSSFCRTLVGLTTRKRSVPNHVWPGAFWPPNTGCRCCMLRAAVPNSGIRKEPSCTPSIPGPSSALGIFRFPVSIQPTEAGNRRVNCGRSVCSASCLPGACTVPYELPDHRGEPLGESSSYSSSSSASIVRGYTALGSYQMTIATPLICAPRHHQQPARGRDI